MDLVLLAIIVSAVVGLGTIIATIIGPILQEIYKRFRDKKDKQVSNNLISEKKVQYPVKLNDNLNDIPIKGSYLVSIVENTPYVDIKSDGDKAFSELDKIVARRFGVTNEDKFSEGAALKARTLLRNDSHFILSEKWERNHEGPWHNKDINIEKIYGNTVDYACLKSLEDHFSKGEKYENPYEKIYRLSGNMIIFCPETNELVLHFRAEGHKFPKHLHTCGGNFEPRKDKGLKECAIREAQEEIFSNLHIEIDNTPVLLMVEEKTNWHMAVFAGAKISKDEVELIKKELKKSTDDKVWNIWEGRPEIIHLDKLVEALKRKFVPTGWQAVVIWIAMGAPCNGIRILDEEKVNEILTSLKGLTVEYDDT